MAGKNQGPNMDQFEAYFRRADLDGDGRISGAEAVAFFQGSSLAKQVLAQIWMHADQNKTGFLGRVEFYNALKLVTVAQSKRELTPDIVNAALYGPAAAKIPPPQINLAATSVPQLNSTGAASAPRMGAVAPTSSQNVGFRAQGVPNPSMNQHYFPSQQNQSMRPPQVMPLPSVTASHPSQGTASPDLARGGNMLGPNVPNSNISNDWLSGQAGSVPNGPRGIGPSTPLQASQLQSPVSMTSQPTANASKALVVSGNGFASGPNSVSSTSASSAITPVSAVPQPLGKQSSLDSLQSAFSMQPVAAPQPLGSTMTASAPGSSSITSSGISAGLGNPTSDNTHLHWPKMKPSDVQKYTKVFLDVDIDRDGKITGEEARNLFLSWRLPREVLKQVWDLSDQDKDSMLSLREFCFALYMMERYREGRPLPAALPPNVMFDETLLSMTGQSKVPCGNAAWGPRPGFGQQQGMQGARPIAPATGLRPPMQVSAPQADSVSQSNQQKSGVPALEDSFVNQLDTRGPNSMNSKPPEATTAGKKVEETQNVILDSKEKLKFYRTKMQELVLYKSRCDNKLNEITERASADKREAESLGSKYEEKYKQVADIASKLTIEEARFCDIQRRVELHQAIVNMEHGGSADGILQVRADRIQSDLEELLKALTERCKKHGLDIKSTALIELPIGWEPGIQEGAALWDEEWDKFEDESFVNDLTLDAKNTSISPRPKSASVHMEKSYGDDSSPHDLYANGKPGNSLSPEPALESESAYSHSEDELARSPRDSLAGRTQLESPSQEFSDVHYGKGFEADSETHRSFDESTTWGAFDNNDDVDSVWGFNTTTIKYSDNEKHKDIFRSSEFDVKPVRTGSSRAESIFPTKSPFMFEDSVPGTPMSRFGNSPRYSEAGDHFFDNSTRFDSFSMHDGGISPRERFTRFDSMSSSKDFGYGGDRLTRFDSMSSTKDFSHSGAGAFTFDDTDPFGSSGPFRVSSENQTPKSSDNWSAF
ncbi:hypothetical protein I3843_07G134200 [Carya illinoinensis]|nr:hypothetical protein I3843_07G134200 [Carya illinoinensis]